MRLGASLLCAVDVSLELTTTQPLAHFEVHLSDTLNTSACGIEIINAH